MKHYNQPHHKTKPPDFLRELARRAKIRPLNESDDIQWVYSCEVDPCHNLAQYKIFGDTFICGRHLDELKARMG